MQNYLPVCIYDSVLSVLA